jgi:sigma54-dependent transcription regulator
VTAAFMAAGMKTKDKRDIKLVDPDEEVANFIIRLEQPLDFERYKAAYMAEVMR